MQIYNLIQIEEANVTGGSITTTIYNMPVDNTNTPVTNYTTKFRVIQNNQMIVFDSEQEYRDWLQQNT